MQRLLLLTFLLFVGCEKQEQPETIKPAPPAKQAIQRRTDYAHVAAIAKYIVTVTSNMPDPYVLKAAIADNLLDSKEVQLIPYWLGYQSMEALQADLTEFRTHLAAIQHLDRETITSYVLQWMDSQLYAAAGPCERSRYNCIGSVVGQSAVMHYGCSMGSPLSLASILCHAGVFVYHHFAGSECNNQYKLCLKLQS